jgi:site-specific recombinase XerD
MRNAEMNMNDKNQLGPWIRRFLLEHMVAERNFSHNTQASYRDTLTLLLPFAAKLGGLAIDRMRVDDLSPTVVRMFLDHVEHDRHCGGSTRNLRLSAIHSLARFIGAHSPVHLSWCSEVRSIPFKKTARTLIGYLEKPEMDALLNAPNRRTAMGARDYALLLFLYNSGARADEAAKLTIGRLRLSEPASVRILGKGNKTRVCPLWPATSCVLTKFVAGRNASDTVFLGRTNLPMTRFGIHRVVTQYGELASESIPTMKDKRISPHSVRHTTAVHLLRAGVDINTIRAWLGHVSLDTTHIYAEVDLEMKAKALASVDISGLPAAPRRPVALPSLMAFLKQI